MAYYLSEDCYVNNNNQLVSESKLTDEDRAFMVDPGTHYDRYHQDDEDDDDYDYDYDDD